jgi:hypothetical protein
MAAPTKLNLKIYQGSTFSEILRWESALKVYSPITNIAKSAPMTISATSHGLPEGWRFKVTGSLGMKEVNTAEYLTATDVSVNSITVNNINSLNYTTYTGGGMLEYNQPVDLAGYTARMQIREKLTSESAIETLTTSNGKIVLNNTTKSITLVLSAATTETYTFKTGVYSLEMEKDGIVVPLVYGNISVEQEVTR